MSDAPQLVVIPANAPEENKDRPAPEQRLRVAAYCRVSTGDAEQLTSFEAQKVYYTEKIMTNPEWLMAGILPTKGSPGPLRKNGRPL